MAGSYSRAGQLNYKSSRIFQLLSFYATKEPILEVYYGLVAPIHDGLYGTGSAISAAGAVFSPDPSKINQQQILDDNLNYLAGQNITSWFFDFPNAEDITIGPLYSTNTSYIVALMKRNR
jgi:hypothetical protein